MMRCILFAAALAILGGCAGYQTGTGLNVFDSKSFWYSGYDGEDSQVGDAGGL